MLRLIIGSAVMATGLNALSAFSQPTPFTYQGQLKQQGSPLTGLVDATFSLYDSNVAETPVAGPLVYDGLVLPAVQVTNGLFSVELDFGVEVFQQGGEWLEIEVRAPHDANDLGAYTTLTPRQRITAAPFALSVPGLATNEAGVEVEGDIHAVGEIAASAYTSNSPFIIKVNPLQMECARFDEANCFMGVGTDAPQAKLHIGGVAGVDGLMFPDGSLQKSAATGGGGVSGSGTTNSIPFWSAGTTLGNSQITQNANGVQLPNGVQLAVGAQGYQLAFGSPNGETGLSIAGPTALKRADLRFDGITLKLNAGPAGSPPANGIAIDTTGKVGIGTTTPASKLDIWALGEGAELLRFSTERPWVFRQIRTGPSAGLQLLSTSGLKAFEITANDGNNVATFVADSVSSRVGIGTTNPIAKLDVYGSGGNAVVGTHNGNGLTAGVFGFSPMFGGNGVIGQADVGSGAYGVWGRSANGIGGFFSGGTYALVADGRAKVDILEIAGADVAEKFLSSDENVEPGTVMEIDPEHPGQLRVARTAYSTLVAGIISGAGDIPIGAVLGNLPGHENAPPVALSGRVWVRCDATQAAIAPGDLLTTSHTAGKAMKAMDVPRAQGAIIGKAMTSLAQQETGLVLALVTLQ
jgi:hypothetical protein